MSSLYIFIVIFIIIPFTYSIDSNPILPSKCEACLITFNEMEQTSLRFRGKSESDLINWMESSCSSLLSYNVHKDKTGINRFHKSKSSTFKTIENLKERGVKIDLGFPHEFLNEPEAEIIHLRHLCDDLLNRKEDDIEIWYYSNRYESLKVLCNDECNGHIEL